MDTTCSALPVVVEWVAVLTPYILENKLFFATCFMQLNMSYTTKNVAYNYFLIAYDTYNWMRQIAKDKFSTSEILFT